MKAINKKLLKKKQKQDYDRTHMSKREIKVDDIVLLKNNLIGSERSFHKNRSVLTLL